MIKNSVGLTLYLRNRTSYDCDFWLKFTSKCQKKFWDVHHLLHTCVIFFRICSCLFLQVILIFYATKFGNGNGNNQVFSQNLSVLPQVWCKRYAAWNNFEKILAFLRELVIRFGSEVHYNVIEKSIIIVVNI